MFLHRLAALPGRAARSLARRIRSAGAQAGTRAATLAGCCPGGTLDTMYRTREAIGAVYLRGAGIEVGALHQPLRVPPEAVVTYVDRMSVADLRSQYGDLVNVPLVEADVIDDGETLVTFADTSQDFVIANHFLEHCEDPIGALQTFFRVLKPGGVLYMVVPDKRFSFDVDRPCTAIEHIIRDHVEGPASSRRAHFDEWTRLVNKCTDEALAEEQTRHLMNINFSIHFHVWGASELLEFITTWPRFVQLQLEVFMRNGPETILVLRRTP